MIVAIVICFMLFHCSGVDQQQPSAGEHRWAIVGQTRPRWPDGVHGLFFHEIFLSLSLVLSLSLSLDFFLSIFLSKPRLFVVFSLRIAACSVFRAKVHRREKRCAWSLDQPHFLAHLIPRGPWKHMGVS